MSQGETAHICSFTGKLSRIVAYDGLKLSDYADMNQVSDLMLRRPPGSGKKTIVLSLLRNIFGPGASKVRVEHKPWRIELPTRKIDVELTTVSSNYHVEMNPSDAGTNDRYVVQEIIKEMAKTRNIDPSGRRTYKVGLSRCRNIVWLTAMEVRS